jgi:META domain
VRSHLPARRLKSLSISLLGCGIVWITPSVIAPTLAKSAEVNRAAVVEDLVGTSWMYAGLGSFTRPVPSDPATVRLRFPAVGKVEVVGPCGSEVGELQTVDQKDQFVVYWQLVGKFASESAAECPGSPRQGIVGDLIRAGLDGTDGGLQAMFRSKGHTFFEDTQSGLTPLAGTSWDVESVDGQLLAPLHWTVDFGETGVVGGSDGCNGFNGFYVTKADRLSTSAISSTAIGCTSDSPLPRPFTKSPTARFTMSADQLRIFDTGGHNFVFRPKSFGLPLTGTTWKSALHGQRISLAFLPESRARISTPCFSTETTFTQQRLRRFGMFYQFAFDLSGSGQIPDKRKCRTGFELVTTLRNVSWRSQDSLVMRLGDQQGLAAESSAPRITFELNTPVDPSQELAGTRWRLDTLSPGAANEIGFRANGTFTFDKQCGNWIYRVPEGSRLDIQQKFTCGERNSIYPFGNLVARFTVSVDGKTLELFNGAERSIAMYIKRK